MNTLDILAKNLRILRATENSRQDTVAFDAGISRTHMSALEAGRGNPTLSTLGLLAQSYNVDIAYLLTDHNKK